MARMLFFYLILLICCSYAYIRGGGPERAGASIFLVATILTAVVLPSVNIRYRGVEIGLLLVDVAMLLAFLAVAVRAERFWPLWMTAMQGVEVMSHIAIKLSPDIVPWAYWNAVVLWSYPMMLVLVLGIHRHRRRVAELGADPSWKNSSGRSRRTRQRSAPESS